MNKENTIKSQPKRIIGTPFTSEYQPSPEAKSKGHQKRNRWIAEIDEIMEEIIELKDPLTQLPYKDKAIKALQRRYVAALLSLKPQIFLDWLDRKYGKVPDRVELQADITETQNINISVDWVISLIKDPVERKRIQYEVLKKKYPGRF